MLKRKLDALIQDPLGSFLQAPRIVYLDEIRRVAFTQAGWSYSKAYAEKLTTVNFLGLKFKRWVDVGEPQYVHSSFGVRRGLSEIHRLSEHEAKTLAAVYYRRISHAHP